jgi:hypothetical protein
MSASDMHNIDLMSKYGEVKLCKCISNCIAQIVITKGFNSRAKNVQQFMIDAQSCFIEHTVLDVCITDDDFALLILKKHS